MAELVHYNVELQLEITIAEPTHIPPPEPPEGYEWIPAQKNWESWDATPASDIELELVQGGTGNIIILYAEITAVGIWSVRGWQEKTWALVLIGTTEPVDFYTDLNWRAVIVTVNVDPETGQVIWSCKGEVSCCADCAVAWKSEQDQK